MRFWVGIAFALVSVFGFAGDLNLFEFEKSCETLFLNVPGSLLLHDDLIANETLAHLGIFHAALKKTLAFPGTEFSTREGALAEFEELLGHNFDHSISRLQLESLDRAVALLAGLIHYQSDAVAAYETWVGKIQLRQDKPMPSFRWLSDKPVNTQERSIGGKSIESWRQQGARAALEQIETDLASRKDLPRTAPGPRFNHDDSRAHHPAFPFFFASWMRDHATVVDFYSAPRSRIYYDLVAELDVAYHESVAH